MTTAIYALSGDPITYGHIDIIERAAKAFSHLIVALGVNPHKKYLLTEAERLWAAKESLKNIPNVEVIFFEGLLVDTAYELNAEVIIRGIRNSADMNYEQTLDQINGTQIEIDTFLLFSKAEYIHVSSSNVKAIQAENGLIEDYVPAPVKKLLEKKISNQFLVGITGVMGVGKSFVAESLERYSQDQEIKVHNIDLDRLANEVYTSEKPGYKKLREKIHDHFGTLDKREIAKIAFNPEIKKGKNEHLDFLNDTFREPIKVLIRKELKGKQGIVLINSAILVESNMLNLCNNHVIFVHADDDVRHERLFAKRGIDPVLAEERIKHTLSYESKKNLVNKEINKTSFGHVFKVNNGRDFGQEDIRALYEKLISYDQASQ